MTNDKQPPSSSSDDKGRTEAGAPADKTADPLATKSNETPTAGSSDKGGQSSPDSGQKPTKQSRLETPKPQRSRFAGFIAVLALLLALGGIGAGLWAWLQIDRRLTAAADESSQLSNAVAALEQNRDTENLQAELGELEDTVAAASEDLKASQEQQARLRQTLDTVQKTVGNSQRDWIMAEAEYLMHIAQHRLRLARDIESAIAALNAADRRLGELGDPLLIPVREALAEELKALENYPRFDQVGVALKLEQLISDLAPPTTMVPANEGEVLQPVADTTDSQGGWQAFVNRIWQELSQHITIRRPEQSQPALPEAEARVYARQMLRLRLEAARLAALSQDGREYHRQLDLALDWIGNHYQGETGQQLTGEIKALNEQEISPELPQIGQALIKLRKYEDRVREEG